METMGSYPDKLLGFNYWENFNTKFTKKIQEKSILFFQLNLRETSCLLRVLILLNLMALAPKREY